MISQQRISQKFHLFKEGPSEWNSVLVVNCLRTHQKKSQLCFSDLSFLVLLVGSLCNCILPDALKTSTVQHDDPNFQGCDSEKRRLRTAFSCLSSISMPQKEVSMSSLFMHSHYKGCLPPWELKKSKKGSLKQKLEDQFTSQ